MELREFINLITNGWKLIFGITLLCVVTTLAVSKILPAKFKSSIDVYVKRQPTAESENFYTYDGYYSTQSSIQYTDTVSGFFHSLQVIKGAAGRIQEDASYVKDRKEPDDITADVEFLEEIAGEIKLKDIAPQVFSVEFSHNDSLKSEMWLKYLGVEVKARVKELNATGDDKFTIELMSEPLVREVKPNLVMNLTAGFLAGLIIGVTGVFVTDYFKKE